MWMKIATAGAVGAVVVGAGAAALASNVGASSSPAPTPQAATADTLASASDARAALGKRGLAVLRRFEHGEWVARKDGKNVTHDAIRGKVTSVSSTSVAVKAADGVTMTFTVDSGTKVVLREHGKGSRQKGAIGDVKSGDTVLVAGTKSGSTLDARHILDTGH